MTDAKWNSKGRYGVGHILRFFLMFVVYFVMLMWPWPGLKEGYASLFRAMGNLLLPTIGDDGRCQFVRADLPKVDVQIKLRKLQTPYGASIDVNTRMTAYVPSGLVAALVLATPVAWKRRGWSLLWGLVAVSAYVLLRAAISIIHTFCGLGGIPDVALFAPGRVMSLLIDFAHMVLVGSAAGGFVVPIFIWVVVTFRRSDWDALFSRTGWPRASTPLVASSAR